MKEVTFEHVFDCDEDTFWDKIFFDEEYNRTLFRDRLRFNLWKQEIHESTDALLRRTVHVQPPVGDVPGAVRKILGERFGYQEHGKFDRKTKRYHVDITPSSAAEKASIYGDLWVEKVGDKRIKRTAKMHVEVRVFMVGGFIEDKVISDMRLSYDKAADFTNEWIKDKGL